jgi:glycosyltransferase involved in cell wall biosynthesis
MHIFMNTLGATCASGLTYVQNVVPHFSARRDIHVTIAVNRQVRHLFDGTSNVFFPDFDTPANPARRFWFEQTVLPRLILGARADVLISAGNFALWNSPVPQILLSGNSLYTSADFDRDLRARREYGFLLDNWARSRLARLSIRWSHATVAPSKTFAEGLWRWTGREVTAIHHGFDPDVFFGDRSPLPAHVQRKIDSAQGALRLLFVSHYNYYRNFETLLRAIPVLRSRLQKKIRLFLTCTLRSEDNPGAYRAEGAAALVRQLGIDTEVVELGAIPYRQVHKVYEQADIYVTPAYAETFAHPLVEAMACGLPVVASDLAVHREICGQAAFYFNRFSPEDLCAQVARVAESAQLCEELSRRGRLRSLDFSWARHVDELLALAAHFASESAEDRSCLRSENMPVLDPNASNSAYVEALK